MYVAALNVKDPFTLNSPFVDILKPLPVIDVEK